MKRTARPNVVAQTVASVAESGSALPLPSVADPATETAHKASKRTVEQNEGKATQGGIANPVAKSAAKATVKPAAKPAAKAAAKAAAKPAPKTTAVAPLAKAAKPKKVKVVRDGFSIPKSEYAVLTELKQRSERLVCPAKKSELLRAGIMVLNAMADAKFVAALKAVPAIKTGRPNKD